MNIAKTKEGTIIDAFRLKENRFLQQETYYCLCCSKKVGIRRSKKGNYFFTHQAKGKQKGESKQHSALKRYFFHLSQKQKKGAQLEYFFQPINRRGDLYFPRTKQVLEIQCSFLSRKVLRKRKEDYKKIDVQDVWLLSGDYCEKSKQATPFY